MLSLRKHYYRCYSPSIHAKEFTQLSDSDSHQYSDFLKQYLFNIYRKNQNEFYW